MRGRQRPSRPPRAAAAGCGADSAGIATGAAAEPHVNDPWSVAPGITISPHRQPSRFEDKTVRSLTNRKLAESKKLERDPIQLESVAL
jgi:hypothetical protein